MPRATTLAGFAALGLLPWRSVLHSPWRAERQASDRLAVLIACSSTILVVAYSLGRLSKSPHSIHPCQGGASVLGCRAACGRCCCEPMPCRRCSLHACPTPLQGVAMSKEELIEMRGRVEEVLPDSRF